MKRIVVFFPSWRYFGHFAQPLFAPLTKEFEIIFLHTEKAVYRWDDCPDLSMQHIQTIDLQSLNTFSFVTALKALRPDCVVVFDKGWVQDRALLHAAEYLKIPRLHIQHGSVAILDEVQTHHRLKRACNEFMKVARTFRLYNATLVQTGLRRWMKSIPFQVQLLLNPNNYYYNHRTEIKADLVCIIGASEREFFLTKEGYDDSELVAMGSPQYEDAYSLLRDGELPVGRNRILLLSQPLFEDHYLPGGLAAKKECLSSIVQAVAALDGVSLAVKPHPRESAQWYGEHFSEDELYVYPKESDLNEAILENRLVIGFFSTALVNALILRRPVGIIRWMGDHGFAPNFDVDGAAMTLRHAEDLENFVKQYKSAFDTSWYAYNASAHRVMAETIDSLCS